MFGLAVTGLDPVNYDLSAYSSYFELDKQTNTKLNTQLKVVVAAGHVFSDIMFIILKFYLLLHFVTTNYYVTNCIHQIKNMPYPVLWH